MAGIGYDPQYAATKVTHYDGLIEANKAEGKRLAELRKQYAEHAPKAKD